jgi:malate dehydrogenase (oxaloacetate-decarboxylating)(NADP+)
MEFGRDYIIPKPLDPRLISRVASAVARAAIETGVAKFKIDDWDAYMTSLDKRTSDHIKRIADIACL